MTISGMRLAETEKILKIGIEIRCCNP